MLVIQLSEENVVKDYDSAPSFPLKNLKGAFGRGGGGVSFMNQVRCYSQKLISSSVLSTDSEYHSPFLDGMLFQRN